MSNSEDLLEALVKSWLTDVQRRGAELYAVNKGNKIFYLSFGGKHRLRFWVKIDLVVKDVRVQVTRPQSNFIERSAFRLNVGNLRSLANRMCLVGEGQAVVSIYLLAELLILCHACRRLVEDYAREYHMQASTNTLLRIESELRQYLTPEEQKRTDNPALQRPERSTNQVLKIKAIGLPWPNKKFGQGNFAGKWCKSARRWNRKVEV